MTALQRVFASSVMKFAYPGHLWMRASSKMFYGTASHYDIVISGGGMVGTAMAAALGQEALLKEHKILILEAGTSKVLDSKHLGPYSSQVCALSPGTVDLLSRFGAWDLIQEMRYKQVKKMQVWDACSKAMITFNQEDLTDNLAYIVENNVILTALTQRLQSFNNVDINYNTKVKTYNLPGTTAEPGGNNDHLTKVKLDDGREFSTELLIGADGFKSLVRQTAGFHTVSWDYKQVGLVAVLNLADDTSNDDAWQRFLPTGPIAMLPLSEDKSCLIWSTSPEDARNLLNLTNDAFTDAVNDAFWNDTNLDPVADGASQWLNNILSNVGLAPYSSQHLAPTVIGVEDNTRAMFPLILCHSSQYVKPRVALIGDAAHRVHPLAGQGVNLGFGDVACLRDVILKAVYSGQVLGDINNLLQYETQRQRYVVPTMATVDGLKRIYSTTFTPAVVARSLGLQVTNAINPLKKAMISHATQ